MASSDCIIYAILEREREGGGGGGGTAPQGNIVRSIQLKMIVPSCQVK